MNRFNNTLYNLRMKLKSNELTTAETFTEREDRLFRKIDLYKRRFHKALDNDLNVPEALSHIFEFTRVINKEIDYLENKKVLEEVLRTYQEFGKILGLFEKLEEL